MKFLIKNNKIIKVSFRLFPFYFYLLNNCERWPVATPFNSLSHLFLISLKNGLDTAVRKIAHISPQAQALCYLPRACPEKYSLNSTRNIDMCSYNHQKLSWRVRL